jgi:hypothetical protein
MTERRYTPTVVLAVVAALIVPAVAQADTIHLAISPEHPQANTQAAEVSASGEASSTGEFVNVLEQNVGPCPAAYTEGFVSGGATSGWHVSPAPAATVPSYSFRGQYDSWTSTVLCGYLTRSDNSTIARAELVVTDGPSAEEIRTAERAAERAKQAAESAANQAKQAAESAANQAKQAAETAAREAKESSELASYLKGVAQREHCSELAESYRADVPSCEADEAALSAEIRAANARDGAEWSAQEAVDLLIPDTFLTARAYAEPGGSKQYPGKTTIDVHTDAFARVTVKLHRYGHSSERFDARPAEKTARHGTVEVEVPWTCERPGGTYSYVITARTNVGKTLTRKGRFQPVSVSRCHSWERAEREAEDRNRREYEARLRQEAAAERERENHYKSECRALDGIPTTVESSEGGFVIVCHNREGQRVSVP